MLDRRREDVKIAIVVKIGKYSGSAICDRINAGNAGNIRELLAAKIQIQRVAFVAAERKSLPEHQAVLIGPKSTLFIFTVIRMRHDLTPKLRSGVFHGFT